MTLKEAGFADEVKKKRGEENSYGDEGRWKWISRPSRPRSGGEAARRTHQSKEKGGQLGRLQKVGSEPRSRGGKKGIFLPPRPPQGETKAVSWGIPLAFVEVKLEFLSEVFVPNSGTELQP